MQSHADDYRPSPFLKWNVTLCWWNLVQGWCQRFSSAGSHVSCLVSGGWNCLAFSFRGIRNYWRSPKTGVGCDAVGYSVSSLTVTKNRSSTVWILGINYFLIPPPQFPMTAVCINAPHNFLLVLLASPTNSLQWAWIPPRPSLVFHLRPLP